MQKNWMEFSTSYIDLSNVKIISRGDSQRMEKYIRQFYELIPERLELLKKALLEEDRAQIRQITHKMAPQLQFFGVQQISIPIKRLELEYLSMSIKELHELVSGIIAKLEDAIAEISTILKLHFE
jgi:HPt (histidine-containing phosphotransfer) domain-containing protein